MLSALDSWSGHRCCLLAALPPGASIVPQTHAIRRLFHEDGTMPCELRSKATPCNATNYFCTKPASWNMEGPEVACDKGRCCALPPLLPPSLPPLTQSAQETFENRVITMTSRQHSVQSWFKCVVQNGVTD